jgi:hypothetical protein
MWWFVFQNVILSICIILIIQYLWEYCKTHYTTRKTKHIVDAQTQKYRNIIKEIQHNTSASNIQSQSNIGQIESIEIANYIPEKDKAQMIQELTQFLRVESGGDL